MPRTSRLPLAALSTRTCIRAMLAVLLCAPMAQAWADPQPLVLRPRGSDDVNKSALPGSLESLRERLEEKLGASVDPGTGDRVMRVVNREKKPSAPSPRPRSSSSGKASTDHHEAGHETSHMPADSPLAAPTGTEPANELSASVAPLGAMTAAEPALALTTRVAGTPAVWDYKGATGPARWGKLDPAYQACSTGKRQSPIDIRDGITVELEPPVFDYKPSEFKVTDTGNTIQVDVSPGSSMTVDGHRYELQEFYFHRPAEEVVEGKRHEMVVHLLHRDAEGHLAMLAVLLDRGEPQKTIQSVWNNLPLERNTPVTARTLLDLPGLLPEKLNYYTYMGSLTMPPCTEGVLWIVLRQPITVSDEQIDIFSRLYPMNARPLQSASDRLIKQN